MPLPDDIPTFTLVAEFPPLSPDGTERQGVLTYTPIPGILPSPDAVYLGVENETLNASGSAIKELIACDAFADPFIWRVDGAVDGYPPFSVNISVAASAGTVNLGAVAEFEALPPDYVVVLGPQGPEGPAGTGGGGSGTPSGTVVAETTFGGTPAAGAAITYSRGDHTHGAPAAPTKASVGLGSVDNTSDANKPVSTATGTAIGVVATALSAHASSSTAVHGITDTSALVLNADPRLNNSRAPSGAAGGDLSGGYPNPTVAKVGGVAVSGAAASGKVLTASSSSAASWQDPAGGGGPSGVSSDGRINEEIVVLQAAASWTIVTTSLGVEIGATVPASVGDHIWFSPSFLRAGGVVFLDIGIKAAAGGVSRYISSGTSTPREEGYAPLYPLVTFTGVVGIREFVVQAGEVDGSGNAKIVLAYKGAANGSDQKLYFGGGYDGAIWTYNPNA